MRRNKHYKAIVLSSRAFGEHNRYISLLTPEGIIDAAAYGARKPGSRFASASQSGAAGEFFLYYNPVKTSYKLTDTAGIKLLATNILPVNASFIFFAELIIATHAAGQPEEVWKLAIWLWRRLFFGLAEDNTFIAKKGGAETTISPVKEYDTYRLSLFLIHSTLRYLHIMGLNPDWQTCSHCSSPLGNRSAIWADTGLICPNCSGTGADNTSSRITLTQEERTTLQKIETNSIDVDTHKDEPQKYKKLLNTMLAKTEKTAEKRLKSLSFLKTTLKT